MRIQPFQGVQTGWRCLQVKQAWYEGRLFQAIWIAWAALFLSSRCKVNRVLSHLPRHLLWTKISAYDNKNYTNASYADNIVIIYDNVFDKKYSLYQIYKHNNVIYFLCFIHYY